MKEKRVEVYRFKRKKPPNSRNKNSYFKQVTSVTWQADLTSTMIVAIKRVGSNIRFSCVIGPMRKTVLRSKHRQAIQTRTPRCLLIACSSSPVAMRAGTVTNTWKALCQALCSGPLCLILTQSINNLWSDHRTVTILILQMKKLKSRSTCYLSKAIQLENGRGRLQMHVGLTPELPPKPLG